MLRAALLCVSLVAALCAVAATMPTITADTQPQLQWTLSLNSTAGTFNSGQTPASITADASGIYIVQNQTLNIATSTGGIVTNSILLSNDSSAVCFAPVTYSVSSITWIYVACTPNIVWAFQPNTAMPLWKTSVVSSVALPAANNSLMPVWDQAPVLTNLAGEVLLMVSGSGALWTLSASTGATARAQLGPYSADLFGATTAATLLQPAFRTATSGVLFVAATGPTDAAVVPSLIARFTVSATVGGAWTLLGTSPTFGNGSFPSTRFSSQSSAQTGRMYWGVLKFNSAPYNQAQELWYWSDDSAAAPVSFASDELSSAMGGAVGVLESADGAWLLPNRASTGIAFFSAADGSLVNWLRLQPSFQYAALLLDGRDNLYVLMQGRVAVAPFNHAATNLTLLWSYDTAADLTNGGYAPLLPVDAPRLLQRLPVGIAGAETLMIVSSALPNADGSLPTGASDRVWSIGSVAAPACADLPGTSDCATCDGAQGTLTARRCVYCIASAVCGELVPPLVQSPYVSTCSDDGYPLGADQCNGGPASKLIAIVVGCSVGAALIAAALICYCAKRKPNPDAYQDIAH